MCIVDINQLTGNISGSERLRCAVGLFDETMKIPHFYDVLCNNNVPFGRPFSYLETFIRCNVSTDELEAVENMHKNSVMNDSADGVAGNETDDLGED